MQFSWEKTFRSLFERCLESYQAGNKDFLSYYGVEDQKFLDDIGCQPRELFDFVEDYGDGGEPSIESAILIASVRRDYFRTIQNGIRSTRQVQSSDLPGKEEKLDGIVWLPRIITKAAAKLKGELHPDIMFSCGGDRKFLKTHDIHPADFLRAVWAADHGEDHAKIAKFVKSYHEVA